MSLEQPAYSDDRKRRILGLTAVFIIYGTTGYYIQALNIARPKIASAFDSTALISWSVSIPGLVGAFVTLIYGKLSDMYGRRIMLLISLIFSLAGLTAAAFSPNFVFLIAATSVGALGIGAMMPLVMAVLGDMFPPIQRSRWIGMLNIPMGIAALSGPYLGGLLTDTLGWNYIFWSVVPFLIAGIILVPLGIPGLASGGVRHKIDVRGSILAILASCTSIVGLSLAGNPYPWMSMEIFGLLGASLIFWILFIRSESCAAEPILDPLVLHNRSFLTVVAATFLSCFGQIAMMVYFPMFLQGVLGTSTTISGWVFMPFTFLMALFGVPVGFLIAKTRRYKWLYVLGFLILTAQMFGNILLSEDTGVFWCVLSAVVGGIGLGAIPTVNTVVVQNAVPMRLLGAAMGALFFSLLMGIAISPAILGSAMNASYARSLSLPGGLEARVDSATLASLENPDALLSQKSMDALEKNIRTPGSEGDTLFRETVNAVRHSMESGLRSVFLIGAIAMLAAFLLILTIPEIPIGSSPDSDSASIPKLRKT